MHEGIHNTHKRKQAQTLTYTCYTSTHTVTHMCLDIRCAHQDKHTQILNKPFTTHFLAYLCHMKVNVYLVIKSRSAKLTEESKQ